MKKYKHKTQVQTVPTDVIFRTFRKGGDVIALFPGMAATREPWLCLAYIHIGQHTSAESELCQRTTRPSTPEEVAPLKAELERIGYQLNVVKRFARKHWYQRMEQLNPSKS